MQSKEFEQILSTLVASYATARAERLRVELGNSATTLPETWEEMLVCTSGNGLAKADAAGFDKRGEVV